MEVDESTSITKLKALRDRAQVQSIEEQKKARFVQMLKEMPDPEVTRAIAKKVYEEIKGAPV